MKTKILDKTDVQVKTKRLAFQVLEDFYAEKQIHIIGIEGGGKLLSEILAEEINSIDPNIEVALHTVSLNKQKPLSENIKLSIDTKELKNKVVILVDDVSNTGKTIFYALQPLLQIEPKTVKVAVLIDRQHKKFPIECNYVGNSLSTTMKEHITVAFEKNKIEGIYLS